MSSLKKDPVGEAILAYARTSEDQEIMVYSDICEDDSIPTSHLLRTLDEMPKIEKLALANCSGHILDIGAGAGVHSTYLKAQGYTVEAIDVSPGAVKYMQEQGLNATQEDFYNIKRKFDTLLMMMNGIGIAGTLSNLESTLIHAKTLLNQNGKLLCDSTDIKYLYTDDEGVLWVDLNTEYYGNFKFQMHYEDHMGDWFDWLYVDFPKLNEIAAKVGLTAKMLYETDHHYLAELTLVD